MRAGRIGTDDVDGVLCIELVDLKPAIDDRHVPAEQVYEKMLPVDEHGVEEVAVGRPGLVLGDVDHDMLPVVRRRQGKQQGAAETGRAITRVDAA